MQSSAEMIELWIPATTVLKLRDTNRNLTDLAAGGSAPGKRELHLLGSLPLEEMHNVYACAQCYSILGIVKRKLEVSLCFFIISTHIEINQAPVPVDALNIYTTSYSDICASSR